MILSKDHELEFRAKGLYKISTSSKWHEKGFLLLETRVKENNSL